jgi:hypothetical protein
VSKRSRREPIEVVEKQYDLGDVLSVLKDQLNVEYLILHRIEGICRDINKICDFLEKKHESNSG